MSFVEFLGDLAATGRILGRGVDAPDRLPFTDLLAHTRAAGLEVHRIRRHHEAAFDRFWYPAARVDVHVVSPYQSETCGFRLGDVHSVTAVRHTVDPEWLEPIAAAPGK